MANDDYLIDPAYPDAYDRSLIDGGRERVIYREGVYAQGAELNESFSIEAAKRRRVGDLIARDGDRIENAAALVDIDAETVHLAAGRIYMLGDVRPVDSATLAGVPMAGDVIIGIRASSSKIDHENDETLLGLHPGTAAHSEPGGLREIVSLHWGFSGDGEAGALYQVYLLRDGSIIDQSPPPTLSPIQDQMARQDYDALGNYVVRGCTVTALGLSGGAQVFSVAEGVANIFGYKRTRNVATRFSEPEAPDLMAITAEPQVFNENAGVDTARIFLNRTPINAVSQVLVTREVTQTVSRGGVANTSDLLDHAPTSVVEVKQGGTTYAAGADFVLQGDRVSWAPGGAEPPGGSSYNVKYRYLEAVSPGDITLDPGRRFIDVAGGATVVGDGQVLASYSYRLPRFDRICLDERGAVVYIKGLAAIAQPQAPKVPAALLSLAVIKNDWFSTPVVDMGDTVMSFPFWLQWRQYRRVIDGLDLIAQSRLQMQIAEREPVAKLGVFVDPLTSDRYRDQGEPQTGAVFGGTLQIPITPSFTSISLAGPQCLNYTEETIVSQLFVTGCMKVNPYQAFAPLAARLTIDPSQDFWVETAEEWTSPATQIFGSGNASRVTSVDVIETTTSEAAGFLREIVIDFRIEGFGAGEFLTELLFDSIDVTPAGPLSADGNGVVEGSFVIPPNVTAGSKSVDAKGSATGVAGTRFVGEGRIDTITRQQLTTVQRFDNTPQRQDRERGGSNGGSGDRDPLAQSFRLTEGRHISSIDVKFCVIGNPAEPVIVELVTMDNGYPTRDVIAQTETDMNTALIDAWHTFHFFPPVFIPAGLDIAFVVKTNDADHAVRIGSRGGFDATLQQWVGAQPYIIGVLFSSSNAATWTAHQDDDMTFRVNCAVFDPLTKTVPLGVVPAVAMSDFIMACESFLPAAGTRIQFEVVAGAEPPIRIEPGQVWERQSYYTGNLTLNAILTGTAKVSPVMGSDLLAIKGHMEASGTYVSRAMAMGSDVTVQSRFRTRLPVGSTLTVEMDEANDAWSAMTPGATELLGDGTIERAFLLDDVDAPQGRIRITLTGDPAARPLLTDLRAFSHA